jgi:hypothetical protein
MNRDILRQSIVILALAAALVVNVLSFSLPLNGQTTGQIANRYPSYFTPAGYVFSIWGIIYLGLIALATYQALPSQRENPRLRRTGFLFAASCLVNILWLFAWHYEVFILVVPALASLAFLLTATYLRLGIGQVQVPTAERWCVHIPISIYLAWAIIATISNTSWMLYHWGWNRWGLTEETWAVTWLVIGALLAAAAIINRRDAAFGLVWIWAYSGIATKFAGTPVVSRTAWLACIAVGLLILFRLFIKQPPIKNSPSE